MKKFFSSVPAWVWAIVVISLLIGFAIYLYFKYFHFPKQGIVKKTSIFSWKDAETEVTVHWDTVNEKINIIGSEKGYWLVRLDNVEQPVRIAKTDVEIVKN